MKYICIWSPQLSFTLSWTWYLSRICSWRFSNGESSLDLTFSWTLLNSLQIEKCKSLHNRRKFWILANFQIFLSHFFNIQTTQFMDSGKNPISMCTQHLLQHPVYSLPKIQLSDLFQSQLNKNYEIGHICLFISYYKSRGPLGTDF